VPSFDRGFKSWTEKSSLNIRRDLGLKPYESLPFHALARYLDVQLWTPKNVQGMATDHLKQLLELDSSSWSAVTIQKNQRYIIIYNPRHSLGRQSNDIMHELSHLLAAHEPSQLIVSADSEVVLRSFDQKREDEADWLAGCLLLPREALLHIKKQGISDEKACDLYKISEQLLTYRFNITGVNIQTNGWPKQGARSGR